MNAVSAILLVIEDNPTADCLRESCTSLSPWIRGQVVTLGTFSKVTSAPDCGWRGLCRPEFSYFCNLGRRRTHTSTLSSTRSTFLVLRPGRHVKKLVAVHRERRGHHGGGHGGAPERDLHRPRVASSPGPAAGKVTPKLFVKALEKVVRSGREPSIEPGRERHA